MKAFWTILFLLLLLSQSSFANPCQEFQEIPFNSQKFERCKSVAQAGDRDSEFGYGLWLISGPDEVRNYSEGLVWVRKAAFNKQPYAQVYLAVALSREEFPAEYRDLVEAYAWFATVNPHPKNSDLTKLEKNMTDEQILQAKELAKTFQEKYTSETSIMGE